MKAGESLEQIRTQSRDEVEKGIWFERLFVAVALQVPEFEIADIWRWSDWPRREELIGLDKSDFGIDLVAQRTSGEWIAIQCKCYDEQRTLGKPEVDKFLACSQQKIFSLRWIVATCPLTKNAKSAIKDTGVTEIDFREYVDIEVDGQIKERPVQELWPLQAEAIDRVMEGFEYHDRGRLIMACGTGKTFTSLRMTERLVADGQRILFVAPSIALVSQARCEWLRQTTRKLRSIVVCSDMTAGGRQEDTGMSVSELVCPVSTDPRVIAGTLLCEGDTCVVFCTYHSLRQVIAAQRDWGAPEFTLAIADEAHRTTGILQKKDEGDINFQEFHDSEQLRARKRLYMTATPRLYTEHSKGKLEDMGVRVVDMGDIEIYGPEFYRLPFAKAVQHGMLSDYRVIVLGVGEGSVKRGLRHQLESIEITDTKKQISPTVSDMTRVLGVSLAVNGVTEGSSLERPRGPLPRVIAFANTIIRSKWYAKALEHPQVLSTITQRKRTQSGDDALKAMKVKAVHLDASSSAFERNKERRELMQAGMKGECRIVCNVRLFTEGVDVPSLDAVAFLDPRNSQVDVVQAVGRVMRRAPGKRFGYIIIPVVIPPGSDMMAALEKGSDGYQTVGRVLRAMQAHDNRLIEDFSSLVDIYEPKIDQVPSDQEWRDPDDDIQRLQQELDLKEAAQGIYAHVVAASGLGKMGQVVADEIAYVVRRASSVFEVEKQEEEFARVLELVLEEDGGAKGVCMIGALMLCNACLLQRRLRSESGMETIIPLEKVAVVGDPIEILEVAWEAILNKDYAPVFSTALELLGVLVRGNRKIDNTIRELAECANRVAEALSDLGYDHAGPLYHSILGSAKSDGAFYTNNISAMMLARLALSSDLMDWSDLGEVGKLRVMDPACGTGTLLMASLQTIKARVAAVQVMDDSQRNVLHKKLVEDVLCGLDINRHGTQLAACNLTLGAPTVDYERMNLVTMPHGPQQDGQIKLGALEILNAVEAYDLGSITKPQRRFDELDAEQVNKSAEIHFPLRDLDVVIMNPPFTARKHRSTKYSESVKKRMQNSELQLIQHLEARDDDVKDVVHSQSFNSFFMPLADVLINSSKGTLAKVIPTAACVSQQALTQRKFLAKRFHVEIVITSHDPKRINFSENTSIHESLLVCRRRADMGERPNKPTCFFALRVMPSTFTEAMEVADEIAKALEGAHKTTDKDKVEVIPKDDTRKWFTMYEQPETRVRQGDWRPCQFFDPVLIQAVKQIDDRKELIQLASCYPLGPGGEAIRTYFKPVSDDKGDYRIFWGRSKDLRNTMEAVPEQTVIAKKGTAVQYKRQAGYVLLSARFRTTSGKLLAIFSEQPALGSMWVPIQAKYMSKDEAKALCAWFNSTIGALQFFFYRGSSLDNPSFSQPALRKLYVPDFRVCSSTMLVEAYERTRLMAVKPWRDAMDDVMREVLDEAVSETIGVDIETLRDWRIRMSMEPTISNKRTP